MTNNLEVFRLLGVPPSSLLVTQVQITNWGNRLRLRCLYDVLNPKSFDVVFDGCTTIHWSEIDNTADERNTAADVVVLDLGPGESGDMAEILTNLFAISVTYGEVTVSKKW